MTNKLHTPTAAETLLTAIALGASDAVEWQERQGQQQLCLSDVLPTEVITPGLRDALESVGVVVGAPIPTDPVFCSAHFPPGWRIVTTDHPMWTDLQDDTGVTRARIFYKAASYDRRAYLAAPVSCEEKTQTP